MNKQKSGHKSGGSPPKNVPTKTSGRDSKTGQFVYVAGTKKAKPASAKTAVKKVLRDKATGRFVVTQEEKNSRVLAATIGGAVIGNLLFPGIGGAVLGGITGALVGSSENKDKKK